MDDSHHNSGVLSLSASHVESPLFSPEISVTGLLWHLLHFYQLQPPSAFLQSLLIWLSWKLETSRSQCQVFFCLFGSDGHKCQPLLKEDRNLSQDPPWRWQIVSCAMFCWIHFSSGREAVQHPVSDTLLLFWYIIFFIFLKVFLRDIHLCGIESLCYSSICQDHVTHCVPPWMIRLLNWV